MTVEIWEEGGAGGGWAAELAFTTRCWIGGDLINEP